MKKYYNEEGKVAILYSPGYGAGWYSWHRIEALIFDPEIVKMILEHKDERPFLLNQKIINYCEATYGDSNYYGGADQLEIMFLEPGTPFYIEEYEGSETIITEPKLLLKA